MHVVFVWCLPVSCHRSHRRASLLSSVFQKLHFEKSLAYRTVKSYFTFANLKLPYVLYVVRSLQCVLEICDSVIQCDKVIFFPARCIPDCILSLFGFKCLYITFIWNTDVFSSSFYVHFWHSKRSKLYIMHSFSKTSECNLK